jgi:hypothetical protein
LDFASYWKEIAVVLAALFAIAGTVFDVKDKASNRITIWGRIFFGLTILSMIGGFYAQWEENVSEAARSKQSQDDMLKIVENTNRNVYDLSRILQPLGRSNVYLGFSPNCIEVKEFCDAAIKEAKQEWPSDDPHISAFTVKDIDWSKWPDITNTPSISLRFYKDRDRAKKYLDGDCLVCTSDMSFGLYFNTSDITASNMPMSVMYLVDSGQLDILVVNNGISPNVNNDSMLSTIDLPGSTLFIQEDSFKPILF